VFTAVQSGLCALCGTMKLSQDCAMVAVIIIPVDAPRCTDEVFAPLHIFFVHLWYIPSIRGVPIGI
jgi:hypothetical protein